MDSPYRRSPTIVILPYNCDSPSDAKQHLLYVSYKVVFLTPTIHFGLLISLYRTPSPSCVILKLQTGMFSLVFIAIRFLFHTKPSGPQTLTLCRISHALQVLDDSQVTIQKAIDAVLGTRLFVLVELFTLDGARDAFLPADIRQIMHSFEFALAISSSTRVYP